MTTITESQGRTHFVPTPEGLMTPFNAEANSFALARGLLNPFDEFAVTAGEFIKKDRRCGINPESEIIYPEKFNEMRQSFSGLALEQLNKIQEDMLLLKECGVSDPRVYLIWANENKNHADNHPHHDTAWDTDDLTKLRRFLIDYTQQDYVTTGYKNEDVGLRIDMFLGFSPHHPVTERMEDTSDPFYHVDEQAEGIQLPLGTILSFAFGAERRENVHYEILPYVHIATPIEDRLTVPRVQVRGDAIPA